MNGLYSFFIYTPILLGLFGDASETPLKSQMFEICDNGVDDDMDGLIDLNDVDDCTCIYNPNIYDVSDIIPNPSFEEYSQCPSSPEDVEVLDSWRLINDAIDISSTYKYLNRCESTYPDILYGDGAIELSYTSNTRRAYVAACLNGTLHKDGVYGLKVDTREGFALSNLILNVFGKADCDSIESSETCLPALSDWTILGQIIPDNVTGEWQRDQFFFIPEFDINAISMGHTCAFGNSLGDPYLVDNLELNLFRLPGDVCRAEISSMTSCGVVTLEANAIPDSCRYQWYREGVALVDYTDDAIILNGEVEGNYQLVVFSDNQCIISDTFVYTPIDYIIPDGELDTTICSGEQLAVGSDVYIETGNYTSVLFTSNGCDSLVHINLTVLDTIYQDISRSICLGDQYELDANLYDESGTYSAVMTGYNGCDSMVLLNLAVVDTLKEARTEQICAGEQYPVGSQFYSQSGYYEVPLISDGGCDSLVLLMLMVFDTSLLHISDTICAGELYPVGSQTFNQTGNYQIDLTSSHGCDSTILLELTVMSSLPGAIHIIDSISCYGEQDAQIELIINNNIESIIWNTGDTARILSDLPPGYYEAVVIDDSNCSSIFSVMIDQPLSLSFVVQGGDLDCDHDVGMIDIIETSGGRSPYTYYMAGLEILDTELLNNLSEGLYEISVVDQNNCKRDTMIEIRDFRGMDSVQLLADATNGIFGDTIHLTALVSGIIEPYQLRWTGPQINCTGCLEQSVMPPLGQQTYSILITDARGCTFRSAIDIRVEAGYYIPNVFTPNNDGANDYFTLFTNEYIEVIEQIQIYNRYGDLIYSGRDIPPNQANNGWDGRQNDDSIDSGVYIYVIHARDRTGNIRQISGDVTLIR